MRPAHLTFCAAQLLAIAPYMQMDAEVIHWRSSK